MRFAHLSSPDRHLFECCAVAGDARYTSGETREAGSARSGTTPGRIGESVRDGDAIDTGVTGRIELTLPDQTIARLGAKTKVSFNDGTRTIDLGEGAVLFQIPKGAGRLKIKANAIAAASTGATGIIERQQFYVKVLVLEGTVRCYLTNRLGESLLVEPGQILISKPDVTALPDRRISTLHER